MTTLAVFGWMSLFFIIVCGSSLVFAWGLFTGSLFWPCVLGAALVLPCLLPLRLPRAFSLALAFFFLLCLATSLCVVVSAPGFAIAFLLIGVVPSVASLLLARPFKKALFRALPFLLTGGAVSVIMYAQTGG